MLCLQQQKSSRGAKPTLALAQLPCQEADVCPGTSHLSAFCHGQESQHRTPNTGTDPLTRPCPPPQRAASMRIRHSCITLEQCRDSCKRLHASAGSYNQLSLSILAPSATPQHPSPKSSSSRTTPPATIRLGKRRPAWAAFSPPRSSSPADRSHLALPSGLLQLWDAEGGHARRTAAAPDPQLPHHQPQLPLAEGQTPAWGDAPPLDQATNLAPTTNGSYQMVA